MQYSTLQEEKKAQEQENKLSQTFNHCKAEYPVVQHDNASSYHLRQSDTPIEVQMSFDNTRNNNSVIATPPIAAMSYAAPPQIFSPANYTMANASAPRAHDDLNHQIEKLSQEMKQCGIMSDRPTNISTNISQGHYAKSEAAAP
jgi:hypothetical protein